ncbi:MAG TPA: serine/threonine-protein kinase [Candidatus Limnocylindrales bacterium]|nr:serine/threonine-protein kinase [Candidatus Limnocylindrales bacterium]
MQEIVGGRYRLETRVGTGGMADVWQATDRRTGARVAVKRLHPRLLADPAARGRLEREIAAARAVTHPRLVPLLDAHVGEDDAWLTMPFVAGGTLADRLRAGRLDERDAAAIGADVADGLAALHRAGIVHRDVTPANILLDGDGRALLGDLGIARPAEDPLDGVTATGDLVGTFRFMAPERLAGEPATAASDAWALGAVLYEAVSGRPPFDVSSPAALLASQRTPPPDPGLEDAALGGLVGRLLDRDPGARPAVADAAAGLRAAAPPLAHGDEPTVVFGAPAVIAAPTATPLAPAPAPPPASAAVPVAPVSRRAPADRSSPLAAPAAASRPASPRRALAAAALLGLVVLVGLAAAGLAPDQGRTADGDATPSVMAQETAVPTPRPSENDDDADDGGGDDAGGGNTDGNGGKAGDNGKGNGKPEDPGKGKGNGRGGD